jgi:predicted RNA methylase
MNKNIKNTLVYKILREVKNFLSGLAYFHRSSLERISIITEDHFLDKRLGIETEGTFVFNDDSVNKDMDRYSPTPYRRIRDILGYLKLTEDDVFVDMGCGAGRVVCFAAVQKIKKAVGIELNGELFCAATQNSKALRNRNSPIDIVKTDVARYDMREGTVFFMSNPFGRRTMADAVDKIRMSLEDNPRKVRIVYYGLQHRHILDDAPWLEQEKEMAEGSAAVWRSKP